jgi:undecaprenyl-diphosphatase
VDPNVAGSSPVDRPFFNSNHMTTWQAFLLGIIQGITEFLPISSSGHLALGQYFLGFENLKDFILFDLVCHLGTLVAIFYIFFPIIKESLNIYQQRFWLVVLGTLPLFPLVLILKPIKSVFDQPQFLGPCFLISACLLFASLYWRFPFQSKGKWQDSVTIGLFQAVAIFPGISRSGATISAARLLGWQKESAIQFSFLLAIPAILGGTVLEVWQAWHAPAATFSAINPWAFVVGFCTSCLVGCFSLWLLIRLVAQDKWSYFAWYCLFVGIATTLYFNFFVDASYGA